VRAVVTLLVLAAAACGGAPNWGVGPVDELRVREGPTSVLTAVVDVAVDEPSRVRVVAAAPEHRVETPWTTAADLEHSIPLVGLRAETEYEVAVEAADPDGTVVGRGTVVHVTRPLPDTLPDFEVAVAEAERMAPGLTMFDAGAWAADGERGRPGGRLVVLDDEGEVVWYHQTFETIGAFTLTPRGTILFNYPPFGIREIDLLGNTVADYTIGPDGNRRTTALDPPTPGRGTLHHEALVLPSGNVIALGERVVTLSARERREICPEGGGRPFDLLDNTIIEFTPAGEVVNQWIVSDIVDPVEHPGSALCGPDGGLRDWAHTNAVVLDDEANALVVSSRNLDLVFAFRYEADDDGPSGELLWSLGPEGSLELENGDPPYHQHAPELDGEGGLLLYDNGNDRPGHSVHDRGDPLYSRAVQYELDLEAGTASQVWEHRIADTERDAPVYAAFLGDANRLANGNVLVDHGGIDRYRPPARGRIIEVVPEGESGGDVVFDLRLAPPWVSYRAERLSTLYVGSDWV
jgi:hypothetical protein